MSVEQNSTTENNVDKEYLTVIIGEQLFGLPVLQIQDVLQAQKVTRIPLVRSEISGSLNLRGRIVTAINMRRFMGLENASGICNDMNVVVEHEQELYSLVVDSVGDVLMLSDDTFEKNPSTMDESWSAVSAGVHRLDGELLVVINVNNLLKSFETVDNTILTN